MCGSHSWVSLSRQQPNLCQKSRARLGKQAEGRIPPSPGLFARGGSYHWRKLTEGDNTLVSERARLSVDSPTTPVLLAKGDWEGKPAFLTHSEDSARPKTGPCGKAWTQVSPLGFRELRQAWMALFGTLGGKQTSGPTASPVTWTEKGNVSTPRKTLLFPQCLLLCAVQASPGHLSFHARHSVSDLGNIQCWFHPVCYFSKAGSLGQKTLKQLQPI